MFKTVPPVVCWQQNYVNDASCTVNSLGESILCYIDNNQPYLHKVSSTGQKIWLQSYQSVVVDSEIQKISVTVSDSHSIYLLIEYPQEVNLFKMDINGVLLWQITHPVRYPSFSGFVVNHQDQLCHLYNNDGHVIVNQYDSNGSKLWTCSHDNLDVIDWVEQASLALDQQDNIYFSYFTKDTPESGEIIIHKLDNKGSIQWITRQTVSNPNDIKIKPCLAINSCNVVYLSYQAPQIRDDYDYDTIIIIIKLDNNGQTYWCKQYTTFSEQLITSLITDSWDDLYLTFLNADNSFSLRKLNPEGQLLWESSQSYIDFKPLEQEVIYIEIDVDLCGNLYFMSKYVGLTLYKLLPSMEYAPIIATGEDGSMYYAYYTNRSTSTSTPTPNETGYDIVVIKKDNRGQTIWQVRERIFNTESDSLNPCLVVFQSVCYVIYQTAGCISGGTLSAPYDIVVLKIDKDGHVIWVRQQVTYNTSRMDQFPSADCDVDGNLYVVYQSLIKPDSLNPNGGTHDLVIFKMDSDGHTNWVRRSLDYYTDKYHPCLRYDRVNNFIYVSYTNHELIDYTDIMILKLDFDGQPAINSRGRPWFAQHSLLNTEMSNDQSVICVDQLGYVYFCYVTLGGTVKDGSKTGQSDLIIGKLNHDGAVIKVTQTPIFNTVDYNDVPDMVYRSGHLFIAYQTTGEVSGQGKIGITDIVVMKMNAITLEVVWITQSNRFNTKMNNRNPSVGVDKDGICFIVFETDGSLNEHIQAGHGSKVVLSQLNTNGTCLWTRV